MRAKPWEQTSPVRLLLSNAVLSHGAFHHWMSADLRGLGHELSFIDPDELCAQYGIELYRRILLQRIAAERPDILLVYPPYDLLRPQDAAAIRALGTAVVGFAYDDPIFLPTWMRTPGLLRRICDEYRQTYELYLTTSRQMVRDCGCDWIKHIRWACNTPTDLGITPRDLPLVLIGAAYPRRVEMVRHLRRAGLRLAIYGADNWRQYPDLANCYGGQLTRPGMFDIYRRAQIALAPADWESTYTPMVKLRSLEIASCGPLQLCEACEDLPDYYEDGKDIVAYQGWDNLVELIRRYQEDPAACREIGTAGYQTTVSRHTWRVRWQEIEDQARPVVERLRDRRQIGRRDDGLPHAMSLAACAGHYEILGDLSTALVAYDEWIEADGESFGALLGKGRTLFLMGRHDDAEKQFKRALGYAADLCGAGVNATVTQRKLGARIGLGRLFGGIFPRQVEVYSHLFLIYAIQDREDDAEALIRRLAANQDVMFIALAALFAAPEPQKMLSPKFAARYLEIILSAKPCVWLGEQKRHAAHLWRLRGNALAAMGLQDEAAQTLAYAGSIAN